MTARTTDADPQPADPKLRLRSEARISAAVIGTMPLMVLAILLMVNRPYIVVLGSGTGLLILAAAAFLVCCGMAVMSYMGRLIPSETDEQTQARAASLSARMTAPMILFILPSLFLLLIGPAVIQLGAHGNQGLSDIEATGSAH